MRPDGGVGNVVEDDPDVRETVRDILQDVARPTAISLRNALRLTLHDRKWSAICGALDIPMM